MVAKPSSSAPPSPAAPASEDTGTSQRLIDAATRLFSAQGFAGAGVKEIAEAAGVNVSLVSYHFGGKEGLFVACLERFGQDRLAVATRVLRPPTSLEDFRARLRMFVEEILTCHATMPDLCALLHRERENGNPAALQVFKGTFLRMFETMVGFIKAAQTQKILKPGLDPQLTATTLVGGVLHFARNDQLSELLYKRTIKDPKYREQLIEHVLAMFLGGAAQ